MPDAADYGDAGSNTIKAASTSPYFSMPNMKAWLFNIDGVEIGEKEAALPGAVARMTEVSKERYDDRPLGDCRRHLTKAAADLPDGFPQREIIEDFPKRQGEGVLCNKPYSGTDVIPTAGRGAFLRPEGPDRVYISGFRVPGSCT